MSTISMRLIRMPHLSVTVSICSCMLALRRSRWDSASSRLTLPKALRRVVRACWSTAIRVVGHVEQRGLGVDDLAEDGGIHGERHVVAGDDLLAVTGTGRLPDVDLVEPVDEWHQEDRTPG